jgi:hypothetical protein
MQSTPALIFWLLKHRPPSFSARVVGVTWSVLWGYTSIALKAPRASPAEAGLMASIMDAAMECQQTFCSDPTLASYMAQKTWPFADIALCQHRILARVFLLYRPEVMEQHKTPSKVQLFHSQAFEYAALLLLTGSCHYAYQEHLLEQQRSNGLQGRAEAQGQSSCSSSSSGGRKQEGRQNNNSNSSSSRCSSVPSSSFSHLVYPPDHEFMAEHLGKEAVAALIRSAALVRSAKDKGEPGMQTATKLHAYLDTGLCALNDIWHQGTLLQSRAEEGAAEPTGLAAAAAATGPASGPAAAAATGPAVTPATGPAAAAAAAASISSMPQDGTTTAAGGAGPSASISIARLRPYVLRLMLQVMVCKCALLEKARGGLIGLSKLLILMSKAASNCSLEERASFISDRGGFLMEVLGLVLAAVDKTAGGNRGGGGNRPFGLFESSEAVHSNVFRLLFSCVREESSEMVRRVPVSRLICQ